MKRSNSIRLIGGAWLGAVLAISTGCGDMASTGRVAGTVKYNGNPVTSGDVNFLSKTGKAAQAKIDANGGYKIDGSVEAGDYTVFVTPPAVEPTGPGMKTTAAQKYPVPRKFQDATSSTFTVTVKSGSNDFPVEFKD